MKTLRTMAEARQYLAPIRGRISIGLVPTMGALHDGHVALFRAARHACGHVVATIFVNPRQFNDPADLAAYPRPEALDLEIAAAAGVDAVFIPSVEEVYPREDATAIAVQGAALGFEGTCRPGHFNSVATVCVKLFNVVQPDVAYFGQKDAQQVAVIQQTVRDLRLALPIEVVPTVRDPDGLALSSRNIRLSADERSRARAIPRALLAALAAQAEGRDPVAAARTALDGLELDYLDVGDFEGHPTLVVAARLGGTRLIDNVPLDQPARAGFPDVRRSVS
jgi:pantoate--beta-alanine ligase